MRRRLIAILVIVPLTASIAYLLRTTPPVTTSSEEAYEYYQAGKAERLKLYYTEAIPLLKEAVRLDPDFALAHMELAKCYSWLRNDSLAKAHSDRSLELSENVTDFERTLIGISHRNIPELARFEGAKQLVERYPDSPEAHSTLAALYWSRNEIDAAIVEYERTVELNPSDALAYNSLGYLYARKGLFDRAVSYLKKYVHVAAGQANPHDSLGEIYMMMHQFEEAIAEFTAALEIKPDFYYALSHRATAYLLLGQLSSARRDYERLLIMDPSGPFVQQATAQLAVIDFLFDEKDIAFSRLDSLIDENPNDVKLLLASAQLHMFDENASAAQALLPRLEQIADSLNMEEKGKSEEFRASIETLKASIELVEGRFVLALEHFKKAEEYCCESDDIPSIYREPGIAIMYSNALIEAGKSEEALEFTEPMVLYSMYHRLAYADALVATGDSSAASEQYEFILSSGAEGYLAKAATETNTELTNR
jgi:tetratricopeptide (TPR) repeat protein